MLICVLITCHNRRDLTLRAIRSVYGQQLDENGRIEIILVDDGSQDGTSQAVADNFHKVVILNGSGKLFWGGGMRAAQNEAESRFSPDYLLWLNDDVELYPDAVSEMLIVSKATHSAVAGTLWDEAQDRVSYGAFVRNGGPLSLTLSKTFSEVSLDTFNGNVVLIPKEIYQKVGSIDAVFPHQYGDLDYGYRIRSMDFAIRNTVTPVGQCQLNGPIGTWEDKSKSKLNRLKIIHSSKVMPLKVRLVFFRRHGGKAWLAHVFASYIKIYLKILLDR